MEQKKDPPPGVDSEMIAIVTSPTGASPSTAGWHSSRGTANRIAAGEQRGDAADPGRMTISDLLQLYIREVRYLHSVGQRATSTLTHETGRVGHLAPLGPIAVEDLTVARVRDWYRSLQATIAATPHSRQRSGNGTATANAALATLRAALRFGESLDLIPPNRERVALLVRRAPRRSRERYLSEAELRRIWDACDVVEDDRRSRGLAVDGVDGCRLLILTGCRHREISSLRWEDVDLEDRVIRLARSKTGRREIPLSAAAVEVLAGRWARTGHADYVFLPLCVRRDGTSPPHLNRFSEVWSEVLAVAGLTWRPVPHHARHTLATLSLRRGHSLVAVADVLGHTDPQTTRVIYGRPLATPGARAVAEDHALAITRAA